MSEENTDSIPQTITRGSVLDDIQTVSEAPEAEAHEEQAAPEAIEDEGENETSEDSATEEEEQDDTDKPKKKGGGFQKRIDKLTKDKSELARRLQELESKLNQPAPQEFTNPTPTGKPSIDNFETYADYIEALSDWKTDQKFQEADRKNAEQSVKRELEEAGKQFTKKLEEAKSRYSDFDEVFNPDLQISGAMQAVLMDSEVGADLAYYLSANPDESDNIARMHPIQAARALGLIEAKLSKAPVKDTKKLSKAPEPIRPLKASSSSSTKSPDDMSYEDYKLWYKKNHGN